jgi:hypothetical protein
MRAVQKALALVAASVLLAACGDKPQTGSQRKSDAPAYSGGQAAYTAGSWKAGDAAAWESQMKARSQNQNEYTRDAAP